MEQAYKQWAVYLIGLILGILVFVALNQTENFGMKYGLIAFGTILFAFLILNTWIFGKKLEEIIAIIYGIVSLITAFWGTFLTFQIIPAVIYGAVIAIVLLAIYLRIEGYIQPQR